MITYKGKYNSANVMLDEVEETTEKQIRGFLEHPAFAHTYIAIMPDCHSGAGAVIGYTAKMNDYVIPNVIGVDIGCFRGDTKVALTDGRELTFLELIEEDKQDKVNYCYSLNKDNKVVISKIVNPRQTKVVNKLIKITLDNKEEIFCTEDHIFYDRDGEEIKACDLIQGQSLMPLYITSSSNIPMKLKSYKDKKKKLKDYAVVYNPSTELFDYVHFLADDYNLNLNVYDRKKGNIRHHSDFNKYNNNPDNLDRVEWKEHWKIHSDHVGETNRLGITGYAVAQKMHSEDFSAMSSKNMTELHQRPEFVEKRNARAIERLREINVREDIKIMQKGVGQRNKATMTDGLFKWVRREEGRQQSRQNGLQNRKVICDVCGKKIFVRKVEEHKRTHLNHTVKSVDKFSCAESPVYCLTIDEYHNFALASGVFVHNCGMSCYKMGTLEGKMVWSSSPSLGKGLDDFIKKRIPSGFARRREPPVSKYDDKVIEIIQLANKLELDGYDVLCQLGTLGGGNHFIEVNRDPEDNYWLVIHSGSRNFGLKIATYYQDKAKELMKKMFIEKEEYKNLEFLPLDMGGSEYIEAMKIAQGFASSNRKLMAKMILEGVFSLDMDKVEQIESVHNYINFEDNIVRKGAIQALSGQRVVIPLNMRDGSLIGVGKGNPKWNFSAPHGAGRVLSRKKAKETLTMEEYQSEMSGVYSSCINKDTLDESPMAYKDKTLIMESIGETVDIEFQMKPVYNFKAGGD